MRPLLIDQKAKKDIAKVVEYAFANKIETETLQKMVDGEASAVGDLPGYSCHLFKDFRVVFSIEHHPMGWCRHMSISVPSDTKMPSIEATQMIMEEFDFQTPIRNCHVQIEETGDTIRPRAINIIEAMKDYKEV
jgi:hypothetical protein